VKVTADDIARLLASAPPRQVSEHVVRAAKKEGVGWGTAVFGLLFGGFGLMFVGLFFPWSIASELELNALGRRTTGVIMSQTETNMSVNETKVIAHRFQFTTEDKASHTAECYTTGPRWPNGATIEVRYLPQDPTVACIEGARLNKAGWAAAFIVVFPLIGFGLAGWTLRARRQTGQLLRTGLVAEVDILSVEATNMQVNKQPVYKIILTSPVQPGGEPMTIKRLNRADIDLADRHAKEKQPLFVLYDPRKPARLIFPEALLNQ